MLDAAVLAAVKQAAEEATTLPWDRVDGYANYLVRQAPTATILSYPVASVPRDNIGWADAAYIVAACNAAPALIAEIERLTAQVEGITAGAKPCALASDTGQPS